MFWSNLLNPASSISQIDLTHVLEHTADAWAALRGGRLFVTGGTGFVGKWLLETFLAANSIYDLDARVTVLTRNAARFRRDAPWIAEAGAVELHEGDIRNFAFPAGNFTHLIHAASDMSLDAPPLEVLDTIVVGTRRVLDFATDRRVGDLLLISSGAVYGPQPDSLERLSEDYRGARSLADTLTAYAEGKRHAEWLTCAYALDSRLRCRIARLFTFFGPYLPSNYAIANFVSDLRANRPIHIAGDGTPVRTYLYAADMAVWLWHALLRGRPGLICNVGGAAPISILELAQRVAALATPALTVHVARQPVAGRASARYVPSVDAARRELGVVPLVMLEDGVERMLLHAGRNKLD